MNKTLKSLSAVFVLLAFLTTVVVCCCVIKESLASMQKKACSHCATKTQDQGTAASHECCFSKASPMEIAKTFGILPLLPVLTLIFIAVLYRRPEPQLAYARSYSNGPPGFVSEVPLYILSRNIRI